MKAEYWKEIEGIVADALEVKTSERRKFIEKRCATSPEIKREVESLLENEAGAENLFKSPAVADYAQFFRADDELDAVVGQEIGNYRILRELGCGGMGAVYLAERNDGKFSQRAAIKMLRREFNVEKVRQTFRREKEILAKLIHPSIARLLDTGTTDDCIPFLVMECVEGEPIDKYCERRKLSLKERLKLFNRICEAVSFAHHNLIIHRDLKPSNILVTETGNPKLLDFGISKLLDAENAEDQTLITAFGAMTPEYASPEQIKGETVTTATDIYSLGVVLFKILTGALPYDFKNKTNGNLLKEITDSEPTLASEAAFKSTSDGRISASELKGDLDNIVQKALSKEPNRRYQTVEQFASDIWRFIDGLPVAARPATLAYRANKFFQRNRISVIAACLIFLSLIGGIAVAMRQAKTAREQAAIAFDAQRQAEMNAAHAKAEEEKAKKISDFMSKIIAYGSPHWMSPGYKYKGETKVTEALKELDEQIDIEFAGQPDVQAELHLRFYNAYHFHVGEDFIRKKRFHVDRALELRKQIYGDYHEKVAEALFTKWSALPTDDPLQAEVLMEAINMMLGTNPNNINLPYMYEGYTSRLAGLFNEIKYEGKNPHQIEKNVRVLSSEELSEMYRKAVQPPTDENNYQIAERMLRESLPILRAHYKEDNYSVVGFECYLSYVLAKQNKWTDFDEHFLVCRQGETKAPDDYLKTYKKKVEIIEKMAIARNTQN